MDERYVNYDKLLEERHRLGLDEMSMIHKVNAFNHFIDNFPTADVVKVKHGKWIEESYIDEKKSDFKCSVCEFDDTFYRDLMFFYKYCPYCGAKMDGGDKA